MDDGDRRFLKVAPLTRRFLRTAGDFWIVFFGLTMPYKIWPD